MKAMILCAGLGTRLRPLTERWPKPALPFLGQPLLRYHLAVLKAAGVSSVGLNTHHLPEVMAATARAECERARLPHHVVHEPVIQGTGGGIRGLRDFLADDDFLVFNGDILFPVDLRPVIEAHRSSGAAATMVLMPMPPGEKYAAVEMNPEREVRRIASYGPGGDSLSPWHFTGVHVISPRVFDFMAPSGAEDINRDIYPRVMQAGLPIRGEVVQAYWSDLGTPSRYLATVRDVLFGQVPLEALGKASPFYSAPKGQGNFWAHPQAQLNAAKVAGPAYFGPGCVLADGARIGSAVSVEENARIGDGARLNRVAVFDETEIAAEEELVEVLAWGAHRVPAPLAP